MEVVFNNKKLQNLYVTGASKKYKLDKNVISNFFEVIAILESAKDIYDLWKQPSLNFENLQGYKNRYSMRITKKYRLEVSIEWTNEIMSVGIIGIEEISKHYGG